MINIEEFDGWCPVTYELIKQYPKLRLYYYLRKMWSCCKDKNGYITFSKAQLMEVCHISDGHTYRKALKEIIDTGELEVMNCGNGKKNKFKFIGISEGENHTTGRGGNHPKGRGENHPKQPKENITIENINNNKEEIIKEEKVFIFDDRFRGYITNELNTMKDVAITNGQSFTDIATSRNIINSIFGEYRRKKERVPESLLPRFTEIYNEELNKIV